MSVLFRITIYLEDDDHKLVDFEETIIFTCQLVERNSNYYFIRSNEARFV